MLAPRPSNAKPLPAALVMKILALEIVAMPVIMFFISYQAAQMGVEISLAIALAVGAVLVVTRSVLKKHFIKKGLLEQPKEQQSSTIYKN